MAKTKAEPGRVAVIVVFIVIFLFIFNAVTKEDKAGIPDGPFSLHFSDSFNTAVATQDDLGISIVLAIDVSGSMGDLPAAGGKAKFLMASDALTSIVEFLQKFHADNPDTLLKIGLLRFSDSPEVLFPLAQADDETLTRLLGLVSDADNFHPTGSTAIGSTLEKGTEILMQSGTLFKSLIVVTDGENTAGVEPDRVLEAMQANRTNKSGGDFAVSTNTVLPSFVAFDLDSGAFSGLKALGARVATAEDAASLQESLQTIFVADITKLEAAGQ